MKPIKIQDGQVFVPSVHDYSLDSWARTSDGGMQLVFTLGTEATVLLIPGTCKPGMWSGRTTNAIVASLDYFDGFPTDPTVWRRYVAEADAPTLTAFIQEIAPDWLLVIDPLVGDASVVYGFGDVRGGQYQQAADVSTFIPKLD